MMKVIEVRLTQDHILVTCQRDHSPVVVLLISLRLFNLLILALLAHLLGLVVDLTLALLVPKVVLIVFQLRALVLPEVFLIKSGTQPLVRLTLLHLMLFLRKGLGLLS